MAGRDGLSLDGLSGRASLIQNPILRGCNPDPSFLRVAGDYFLATSTFEWFPGVQIHHSRDLVHWRLLTRPLDRLSQLDLRGVPDSGGIWAPCLSHDGGDKDGFSEALLGLCAHDATDGACSRNSIFSSTGKTLNKG